MYKTFYLKFESKEQWESIANSLGMCRYDENNELSFYYLPNSEVDVIGTIYNDDGVYRMKETYSLHNEDEFETVKPPTSKDGYHVNVISKNSLPNELLSFTINPLKPRSRYA